MGLAHGQFLPTNLSALDMSVFGKESGAFGEGTTPLGGNQISSHDFMGSKSQNRSPGVNYVNNFRLFSFSTGTQFGLGDANGQYTGFQPPNPIFNNGSALSVTSYAGPTPIMTYTSYLPPGIYTIAFGCNDAVGMAAQLLLSDGTLKVISPVYSGNGVWAAYPSPLPTGILSVVTSTTNTLGLLLINAPFHAFKLVIDSRLLFGNNRAFAPRADMSVGAIGDNDYKTL